LGRDLACKDQPSYTSHLWHGRAFYTYTRNPESAQRDRLMIDTNRSNAKLEALRLLQTAFRGAPPLGYFYGCSERADAILAESKTLVVRDKQEQVGNSMCHVIDAATKNGQFTLWLDPRHGYNIAQAQMVKRPGDSFMESSQPMPPGREIRQMVKGVRFEKIAGTWVPMEADIEFAYKDSKDPTDPKKNYSSRIHHKKTMVQLSPAFSTLRAFVPDDVRDGTRAAFAGGERRPILQLYRWQGGQLKPEPVSTTDQK